MLNVLEKHKLIGGKGVTNTLTYLENTNEDFAECEGWTRVKIEDSTLKYQPYDYILKGDNITDTNIQGSTVVFSGMSIVDDPTFGKVLNFNGSGSVKVTNCPVSDKDNTPITIEMWANLSNSQSAYAPRFFMIVEDNKGFNLEYTGGFFRITADTPSNYVDTPFDSKFDTWRHIAICMKPNEGKIFIDGVLRNSFTAHSRSFKKPIVNIGMDSGGSNKVKGMFCNFAITRGIKYTKDFDPYGNVGAEGEGQRVSNLIPIPSNLKKATIDWKGEGTISTYKFEARGIDDSTTLYLSGDNMTDQSLDPKNTTFTSDTILVDNGKFNKGMDFTRAGEVVYAYDGMKNIDMSKDFTIDWWEYSTATTSGGGLFTNRAKGSTGSACILFGHNGTQIYMGNTSSWNGFNNVAFKDKVNNEWVHWALVKKANTWTSYRNGKQFWTATSTIVAGKTDGDNCCVGGWVGTNLDTKPYNAIISEFRISNKAIWTKNFTPPSNPYKQDILEEHEVNKGDDIKEYLPCKLKEKVQGDKTISNVSIEMRHGTINDVKYPVGTDNKKDNILYLYREGNEYLPITGGWVNNYVYTNASSVKFSKNVENIQLTCRATNPLYNAGYTEVRTKNAIDVTNYSTLTFTVSTLGSNQHHAFSLMIGTLSGDRISSVAKHVEAWKTSNLTMKEFTIDISSLSGTHYIGAYTQSNDGVDYSLLIHEIRLEK